MPVGDDDEVESLEIDASGSDVLAEDVGIVAGVEENPLSVVLDQRRIAPVLLHRGRLAEGVVEDGDAIGGAAARACTSYPPSSNTSTSDAVNPSRCDMVASCNGCDRSIAQGTHGIKRLKRRKPGHLGRAFVTLDLRTARLEHRLEQLVEHQQRPVVELEDRLEGRLSSAVSAVPSAPVMTGSPAPIVIVANTSPLTLTENDPPPRRRSPRSARRRSARDREVERHRHVLAARCWRRWRCTSARRARAGR